jgi:hypothetical protein
MKSQVANVVVPSNIVANSAKLHKVASLVLAIFFLGLFIDYGGGIGIKNVFGALALGWVLLRARSFRILRHRRLDFIVLLVIPAFLGLVHLGLAVVDLSNNTDLVTYAVRFYNTISSFLLILLFPIFYFAGSQTVKRQMSIGFRLVSILILVLFALQVVGVIHLTDYTEIADTYHIGFIGYDPRLPEAPSSQQGQLAPRIAFAMPLAFGVELATSAVSATMMLLSLLVVGSRGLLLGVILLFVIWLVLSLSMARRRIVLLRIGIFIAVAVITLGLFEPIRFRLTGVFLERTASLVNVEDASTLARLGHFEGYRNLIQNDPWKLFIGAGPAGYIDNTYFASLGADPRVETTEIPLLNLSIYYGLPYAILYAVWLFRGAWRLWRLRKVPEFQKSDLGLVLGAVIFFITGNTNPQMTAPFAIVAYMLLVVRADELRQSRLAVANGLESLNRRRTGGQKENGASRRYYTQL